MGNEETTGKPVDNAAQTTIEYISPQSSTTSQPTSASTSETQHSLAPTPSLFSGNTISSTLPCNIAPPPPATTTPVPPSPVTSGTTLQNVPLSVPNEATHLREELISYHPGKYRNVVVPQDLRHIRIAVVGPTGSGKSCLINTTSRSLNPANTLPRVPEQGSGGEGSLFVEDVIFDDCDFIYVDTRGFWRGGPAEAIEFVHIVEGILHHGDKISRLSADPSEFSLEKEVKCQEPISNRIHGVIIVLKANDPRLLSGVYNSSLEIPRLLCRGLGISPITVVTHDDELASDAERLQAKKAASACSGSAIEDTYLIANYT